MFLFNGRARKLDVLAETIRVYLDGQADPGKIGSAFRVAVRRDQEFLFGGLSSGGGRYDRLDVIEINAGVVEPGFNARLQGQITDLVNREWNGNDKKPLVSVRATDFAGDRQLDI